MRAAVKMLSRSVLILVLLAGVAASSAAAEVDPPGFAPVPLKGSQTIRMNVLCFEHQVGYDAPATCRGAVMFHDASGRELKSSTYELAPGQTMHLQLTIPANTAAGAPIQRVAIIPCILPDPGGVAVPSVEVFDRDAGRMVLHINPAAVRMSEFNNSLTDPGSIAGFDPQPDPPVFPVATLRTNQALRMNVFCFEHAVNLAAPEACRGTIMFHDAAGNVLKRARYDLAPGQSASVGLAAPGRSGLVGIIPCIIPEPGGRAVPNIEVLDSEGRLALLINPTATRASRLKQVVVR